MKTKIERKYILFDGANLLGVMLWGGALYFVLKGQWDWTLILSVFGTLLLSFTYWHRKRQKPLHDIVLMVCIVIAFLTSSFLAGFVSESINKSAEQQSICGEISRITASTGRQMARFQLQSAQKSMTFLQVDKRPDLMQYHKKLCIRYSIDPKWSRYPYVHHMSEQK